MAGFNSGKNKSEKSINFFKRKDKGNDINNVVPNQQAIHQNNAMHQQQVQQMQEQQRITYQQQIYEQQQREEQQRLAYEQQQREEQQRLAYEQQQIEELRRIREEEKMRQMQQNSSMHQQFNGYQQPIEYGAPQNVNQQGAPNAQQYQPNNTNPQDIGLDVKSHYDNKNIAIIFDNQIERFYVESSNMKVATEPYMSKLHLKDDSNLDAIIGSILSDLEDEGVVGNLPRDIVGGSNNESAGFTQQYTPQYSPQQQAIPYEQKLSPIQSATGGNLMNMPNIPQGDNNLVGNKVSLDLEVL